MAKGDFTGPVKVGLMIFAGVAIVVGGGGYMLSASHVLTAPARVLSKTMETGNIINNYEWFHDANGQFKARVGQIADMKRQVADAGDDRRERARLNVDLGATRQSCRDIATRYNANAIKTNRSIFMGREAPESLSMEACEQ